AFSSSTLSAGNITLNATGDATAAVGVSGTGTTRTVTLSTITGTGTLGISIAAGTATDTAGNTAPAAGPSTAFTVDNLGPTIGSGENDADGIAVASPIVLNGGTIKDTLGNNAALGFTAPNTSAVLVDNTAPTAALTYSPASSAKSGSVLTITATFNEAMADSP